VSSREARASTAIPCILGLKRTKSDRFVKFHNLHYPQLRCQILNQTHLVSSKVYTIHKLIFWFCHFCIALGILRWFF
jgi:hypothetical protein